jgi:hypothetical protein
MTGSPWKRFAELRKRRRLPDILYPKSHDFGHHQVRALAFRAARKAGKKYFLVLSIRPAENRLLLSA